MSYDRRSRNEQLDLPYGPQESIRRANQLGAGLPWWQDGRFQNIGSRLSTDPTDLIGHGLLKRAFEGGPPVRSGDWDGRLIVHPRKLLEACCKTMGLRPVWVEGDTRNGRHLLASEDTMLRLSFYSRGTGASAYIISTNPTRVHYASQLFNRLLEHEDPRKGMVYTLAKGMGGYRISHIGLAGTPIERSNYSQNVLAAYDHVVEDLNSEAPCGRLVILAGEPGTGKTYLVRSLLGEVPKAAFVVIPPHLVEELGSPEILPSLTAAKNEMDGPIVMIIEDADQCLVPRRAGTKDGNMNAISSLLNLGDGILGSVLDLRIIATTNAKEIEMDPAIKRPGRLCKYAHVGPLSPAEASQTLYRLTGKKTAQEESPMTLAEVYLKARTLGWKPPVKTAAQKHEEHPIRSEIL